eukprot:TRINITY_DN6613_c0_g1_i2.p1 TRINITY_DN6613_c0_g1~~TRINITY_DN6613_c0_g1_i2.p1  ORF type:complete len:190 (-),score=-13.24 TRINITY_DN6613_c0_g1_i2:742-1311(-)
MMVYVIFRLYKYGDQILKNLTINMQVKSNTNRDIRLKNGNFHSCKSTFAFLQYICIKLQQLLKYSIGLKKIIKIKSKLKLCRQQIHYVVTIVEILLIQLVVGGGLGIIGKWVPKEKLGISLSHNLGEGVGKKQYICWSTYKSWLFNTNQLVLRIFKICLLESIHFFKYFSYKWRIITIIEIICDYVCFC